MKSLGKIVFITILALNVFFIQGRFAFADDMTTSTATSTQNDQSVTTDITASSSPSPDTTDTSSTLPVSADISSSTPSVATSTNLDTGTDATTTPPVVTPLASTTPDAGVVTGDADAFVNLSNVVNVNLVDSDGLLSLLNLFAPYIGNIDFSNANSSISCATCSEGTITNNNSSTVGNDLSVTADTGDNTVNASSGFISTGNANAAGNLINIANTNFTNSNYLLLVLNNFSQLNGDIVLPGASFFNNATGTGSTTDVTNANSAALGNNQDVSANTGDNAATGTSTVSTGQSTAASNVLNLVNANVTDGEPIFILVRVFGTWNGNVYSAPAGLYWQQSPDGLLLTGAGARNVLSSGDASSSISNTNSANVQNNVHVYALTGANHIGGSGTINTGNANAVGNTVNIVNTNIVGRNVLLALINIFGTWNGNLAFGQPDLWVGAQASVSENPLTPGDTINYQMTIKNRGTADATNVTVSTSDSNSGLVTVSDAGGGTVGNNNGLSWTFPLIPAGGTETVSYQETMSSVAGNQGQFTEQVSAKEFEDDANATDNTDQISFATGFPLIGNVHGSDLWVKESNSTNATVPPGSAVHYAITLGNDDRGGIAHDVNLIESLHDPMGNVISSSTWPIGQVNPGDEFAVNYDAVFPTEARSGHYISNVTLEGLDAYGQAKVLGSSDVYIVNPADYPATSIPLVINVPPPTITKVSAKNSGTQSSVSLGKGKKNVYATKPPKTTVATAPAEVPLVFQLPTVPSNVEEASQQPAPTVNTSLVANIGSFFSGIFSAFK